MVSQKFLPDGYDLCVKLDRKCCIVLIPVFDLSNSGYELAKLVPWSSNPNEWR